MKTAQRRIRGLYVNDEFKIIWKEEVVAIFKVLFLEFVCAG
jgi:hypothetical protein